jgi:hypothetical protein
MPLRTDELWFGSSLVREGERRQQALPLGGVSEQNREESGRVVDRRREGTGGSVAELMPVGEDYRARPKGGSGADTIGQDGGGNAHGRYWCLVHYAVTVGTPDYPSRIPDMHTIHDPMISVS